MSTLHVVVPQGIDDPAEPSGGNVYDRRICTGLAASGWSVRERDVPGHWPEPDDAARNALAESLRAIPDASVTLLDGLIASSTPQVLEPHADRLRMVVLVHTPLGQGLPPDAPVAVAERAALSAARAVVTTSHWTQRWLVETYGLPTGRVHVAEPGADVADLAPGTFAGGQLLCVGAVTPGKGHDVLVAALAAVADLPWRCLCVGPLTRDRGFAVQVDQQAQTDGIGDRVRFTGPRHGADLSASYAAADLLVLPSRAETYGIVVVEALAHAVPAVASDVGGVGEALGRGADGRRPGLLVAPDDHEALAAALRSWLVDPDLRFRLRRSARERRTTLTRWSQTTERLAHILGQLAA
ncbi:glycosyltransferase family 4 protein [Angustibacter sp. McL0619]|uniref:glycosyltransferase family 4 protein n=1 Tax=Angustibacter sp. McL0619 TaxID=3415676 RepID=UPI003CEF402B